MWGAKLFIVEAADQVWFSWLFPLGGSPEGVKDASNKAPNGCVGFRSVFFFIRKGFQKGFKRASKYYMKSKHCIQMHSKLKYIKMLV